jgi:hypothetical protein
MPSHEPKNVQLSWQPGWAQTTSQMGQKEKETVNLERTEAETDARKKTYYEELWIGAYR